ncbi:hypothetical protein [Embleya hyalina]|uniref:Uncharacterized protein n=1 Tax=Embleya hyalina TaxID=516124 RepID=A0A401YZA5_9ACTN|nr:hypothetical protein [Embleya hyalina]GCD99890.1 hypothetical protein EHYA_07612 [Embleya hyalina]
MSRTKRIKRIAAAMPIVQQLTDYTRDVHKGAAIWDRESLTLWLATPFSQHRDAEALERSNFEVISERLSEEHPETIQALHFGHWAYGWYDRIYVRRDDALALRSVQQWIDQLADYGVADDVHYSETEWEMNHPSDTECYAQEDCECPVRELERKIDAHECITLFREAIEDGSASPSNDYAWDCPYCYEWDQNHVEAGEREEAIRAGEIRLMYRALESAGQMRLPL